MKTQSMLMPKWALYQRGFDFKGNSWVDFGHSGCHTCNSVSYWMCICVRVSVIASVSARPLTRTVFNIPMVGWQLQRQSKEKGDDCHAVADWAQAVSSYCPYIHAHMPSHTHSHTSIETYIRWASREWSLDRGQSCLCQGPTEICQWQPLAY